MTEKDDIIDDDAATVPTGSGGAAARSNDTNIDAVSAIPPDPTTSSSTTTTPEHTASSPNRMARLFGGLFSGGAAAGDGAALNNDSSASDLDAYELARQSMSFTSLKTDEPSAIDFLQDDPADMTYARRLALCLMKYKWYYPQKEAEEKEGEEKSEDKKEEEQEQLLTSTNGETTTTATPTAPPLAASTPPVHSNHSMIAHATTRKPSLARAWAYFEHVALPRYIVHEKDPNTPKKNIVHRALRKLFCKANKQLERAEPGENEHPTKLYSAIFTPLKQMGDWGIGIGLYYSTLRSITVLMVVAGLLNIVNIHYFGSTEYSEGQPGIIPLTQGSAVCTETEWVPCVDCTEDDFADHRIANGTYYDETTGTNVTVPFALRNTCDGATLQQGMISYGTLLLVLVGIQVMNYYQRHMEVKFDEDEQTAQDYSIVITNPPPDATDPKEWKDFFYENFNGAPVTACTVALDNDFLVRSLVERREKMRQIEMMLEPGTSLDTLTLARIAAQTERDRTVLQKVMALLSPGIPELFGRVTVLTARVQGLAQQDYPASNVFVSFETEEAQRTVLTEMSVGSSQAWRNKTSAVAPHCLFRGERVLFVKEPDEPSTVRWQDLNVKFFGKLKQLFYTTVASVCAIALIAFIVRLIYDRSAGVAAIAISLFNSAFPMFAKFLTSLESHAAEGGKQTSLYFKIAAFRWVNTAIVITIITPFTETLEDGGLINSIYAIFLAEIVTANAIQLLDPMGHVQRHVLAPRAQTQDLMDLKMQGQVFELAERYTNMTKILFLAVWYCSVFPGALFLGAFTLLVNYFVDRFALMRTWKRPPQLGTRISKFSRRYFFSTAIVAMGIVSAYYWSGFPYDNLCENDDIALVDELGGATVPENATWTITPVSTNATTAFVSLSDSTYRYCLQDFYRTKGQSFPPLSKFQPEGDEWMTDDQETVVNIYGWTSLAIMALVCLKFVWGWAEGLQGFFRSTYKPTGKSQGINFSDVPSISSYVPQIASTVYAYPLLACDSDGIDEELFDWTDPSRPYSFYDLTKDAHELLAGLNIGEKHVFSVLSHWPPEKKKKENDKSK